MSEKQVFEGSRAFLMIPPAIARDKELLKKPKTIILMGEIISMLNVTGEFFMSNKKIAERLDVSARTVNEYLGILESKKLIERTKIISQENGAIVGRQIRAGVDLVKYTSLGWGNTLHGGSETHFTPLVKPTSHKYNSNNRTTNRTVEDTYSSADAEQPIPYKEIIDYLNSKTRKHLDYRTKSYQRLIRGRWNDKSRKDKTPEQKLADFKKVIDNKAFDWQGNAKMWNYMKPSTLFAPSHFDEYLNQNDTRYVPPANGGYGGEADLPPLPDDDDLPFQGGEIMQSLEGIAIKTEKSDKMCLKHNIPMALDRQGKPFCTECIKEQIKAEKEKQVAKFNHDKIVSILRRKSLVDDVNDFDKLFSNFEADKGSKEAQMGNLAYKVAHELIDNPQKPITALFYGTPGEGKSHLAMSVLNEVNQKSEPPQKCLFVDINNLFDAIYHSKDDPTSWWTEYNAIQFLGGVDVLVIDDFGSESSMRRDATEATEFKQKVLKKILDKQRRLIVTTNLTLSQLQQAYNPKIVSRLLSDSRGRRLDFTGISDKRLEI